MSFILEYALDFIRKNLKDSEVKQLCEILGKGLTAKSRESAWSPEEILKSEG